MSLPERQLDEQGLLLALLKAISGGWISPAHFDRMARDFNIPDGGPTIFFLTGLIRWGIRTHRIDDAAVTRESLPSALRQLYASLLARRDGRLR